MCFAEFQLTFWIWKHFVRNMVLVATQPLTWDWGLWVAKNNFLWVRTMMSTLPLYTCISSFQWFTIFVWPSAALYDSDTVVGCVSSHWQFMRCHSDHFWPFPMIYNVFMEFPMFARLYLTYHYIDGPSMHSPYYSIPIQCVPDLLQLCFDFIYLCRYQYSDVSIIYSFGWLYYYYRFRLWSLCTITLLHKVSQTWELPRACQ